jgi:peptide/nickel transport system permease protein
MLSYLLKKIAYSILVLLGVVIVLTFLFFQFIGKDGKAVYEMTGQNTDQKTIDLIRKEYALDQPVGVQMLLYLNDLSPLSVHSENPGSPTFRAPGKYKSILLFSVSGREWVIKLPYFRRSYQTNREVGNIISDVLPTTVILALSSILLATVLGIFIGIICALYKNTWVDRFLLFLSTTGMALPSFFAAIVISWLLGYLLHRYTGLMPWGNLYSVNDFTGEKYLDIRNLVLPAFTLGIRPLAVIIQLTRNSLLDVLSKDYIRTARAKGLSPFRVLMKHTLRNTLNPLITAISGWMGGLLAGAVFVEYIFGWKGIGKEIVDGLQKLDYPVVMGCVITVAMLFVAINIVVDILYGWVDPRVRLS